uniref:Membrane protein a147 n=1 Tax=Mastomys natalensis cytomegalovirus 2 TaxID=2973540 RepID=A0A9Y1IKV9_9BETA|nr:membrane protein a147 [Mastomys natalensis cytomegalovirus 2]WEG69273.1 membrane protein a147 [Mastomys natalensis cytomegalovirus 2]WEG69412.1 membrane protein a147 [Mastomys natalensis cytomegalovirus 2]WEG69550.1 membrane protein a147 [Mastomys natalensis cytomegalovirus 2]WEG69688.1 membrane protein a147 [Mastomys natalensis cytomegalovirus 2]
MVTRFLILMVHAAMLSTSSDSTDRDTPITLHVLSTLYDDDEFDSAMYLYYSFPLICIENSSIQHLYPSHGNDTGEIDFMSKSKNRLQRIRTDLMSTPHSFTVHYDCAMTSKATSCIISYIKEHQTILVVSETCDKAYGTCSDLGVTYSTDEGKNVSHSIQGDNDTQFWASVDLYTKWLETHLLLVQRSNPSEMNVTIDIYNTPDTVVTCKVRSYIPVRFKVFIEATEAHVSAFDDSSIMGDEFSQENTVFSGDAAITVPVNKSVKFLCEVRSYLGWAAYYSITVNNITQKVTEDLKMVLVNYTTGVPFNVTGFNRVSANVPALTPPTTLAKIVGIFAAVVLLIILVAVILILVYKDFIMKCYRRETSIKEADE